MARASTSAAIAPSAVRPSSGSASGFAGRSGEHHVAVERRVHRIDRAREAGLRHHREPLRLRLGQRRVGRDDGERRVLARAPPLARGASASGGNVGGKAAPAELAVALERRGPEMRPVADGDAAAGIDRRERADGEAVARHRRSRADAALEVDGGGAQDRRRRCRARIVRAAAAAARSRARDRAESGPSSCRRR